VKISANWKLERHTIELIKAFARVLGVTQVQLLADSVATGAKVHTVGTRNALAQWKELLRRYSAGTQVELSVVAGPDGNPAARVLIGGEELENVVGAVAVEADRGHAHVFVAVSDPLDNEVATVRVGRDVLWVRPLVAAARLPWPIDPSVTVVRSLGELVPQEAEAS